MEYTNKLLKGISHVFMCKCAARNVNYQIKKKIMEKKDLIFEYSYENIFLISS